MEMCDEVLPTCLQTGCKKLALKEDNVRVVLEADGTEVDEEDYFNFLPSDTTLLFLTNNDKWSHESSEPVSRDEPDSADGTTKKLPSSHKMAALLKGDISRIISMSDEDLQVLAEADTTELAQDLGESIVYAQSLQEACQRHLDDRVQTREAIDLLRLYSKAHSISPYVETESSKKRRHSRDISSSS
ncbi:hypothetical protein C0Q70_02271 [Pomacea canaliculata]|uniref:CIDE-N domain-containing protein n=1 Tax=Pomacea canaliculata TaxID=400727 RepID=A0A2T7PPG8_POMCA|nr:hypothetical protein C0Q70_02271 [Pomacea canaliculata]